MNVASPPSLVIRRLGPSDTDTDTVVGAAHLSDEPPRREWTERFVTGRDYAMFLAELDGVPVGFLTTV